MHCPFLAIIPHSLNAEMAVSQLSFFMKRRRTALLFDADSIEYINTVPSVECLSAYKENFEYHHKLCSCLRSEIVSLSDAVLAGQYDAIDSCELAVVVCSDELFPLLLHDIVGCHFAALSDFQVALMHSGERYDIRESIDFFTKNSTSHMFFSTMSPGSIEKWKIVDIGKS